MTNLQQNLACAIRERNALLAACKKAYEMMKDKWSDADGGGPAFHPEDMEFLRKEIAKCELQVCPPDCEPNLRRHRWVPGGARIGGGTEHCAKCLTLRNGNESDWCEGVPK